MKTLKTFLAISVLALTISCGGKNKDAPMPEPPAATTGIANVTLKSGTATKTIVGNCGWAKVMGNNYVAGNDATANTRVLNIDFNVDGPPSQTTTYKIVSSADNSAKKPTDVVISFAEIVGQTLYGWDSNINSGALIGGLTLTVEGNKITINFDGMILKPQTNPGLFTNGNVGEYAKNGILKGTFVFYK